MLKDELFNSSNELFVLQQKMNTYLDYLFMKDTTGTPEQVIKSVLESDEYNDSVKKHPELDSLIEGWRGKVKNYTYRTKIELLTKSYSKQLENFSKDGIDNVLEFINCRRSNHGRAINDIELSNEAKKIFELMEEYKKSIKKIFIDNGIDITHITSIPPEKIEGGKLRKSLNRANNYETEVIDSVFASSSPVDGNNPYIARCNSGMIILGRNAYIYGSNHIDVIQDSEGKKHAVLKNPNYVYYINPESFMPVCNVTINCDTNKPIFEFSEEWISDKEIDISDPNQVRKVDEVRDVTRLLEHYTILCDVQEKRIGMEARRLGRRDKVLKYIKSKIDDGSVRYINQEVGINVREFPNFDEKM